MAGNRENAGEAKKKSRILLVDDHPLVRRGLAFVLNGEPDLEVCGECEDGASALEAIERLSPDLAIIDLTLSKGDGLDLIREIRRRWPATLTMVLSMHEESIYAERSMRAGARGYVMKEAAGSKVVEAARRVLAGGIYLSDTMSLQLLNRFVQGGPAPLRSPVDMLTDRELQVFRMIGRGKETRLIAEDLGLSIKTVETYRERIKRKLALRNATELVQRATIWAQESQETIPSAQPEAPGK